jgi:hypothetical protein
MNDTVLKFLKTRFGKAKRVSGGSYRVACPTCDPAHSKKMKRYISPHWPNSNCFICNKVLPLSSLLDKSVIHDFERVAAPDEQEYPYAKIAPYNASARLSELAADHPAIQFLSNDSLYAYEHYNNLGVSYIPSGCGINIRFDSGFTVNTSESLFFPVFDSNQEYVGWQIRFIPGTWNGDRFQFMKYMHLFPKGDYLFNYCLAKQYPVVVVVEGAKKALKLANAVATLGKGISDKQKQLIQEWKDIVLILDSEEDTQKQAEELRTEFLMNGRRCTSIDLGKYGFASPDEATTEELQKIINTEVWEKKNAQ